MKIFLVNYNNFVNIDVKVVKTPLANYLRLFKEYCPQTDEKKKIMAKVLYVSIIGSLIYVMVYTRSNIAYVVRVVSRFMSNQDMQIIKGALLGMYSLWVLLLLIGFLNYRRLLFYLQLKYHM